MVYSFLQAVKYAALVRQFQLGEPQRYRPLDPEPRRRPADIPAGRDTIDDWMFDDLETPLSPVAQSLSRELDRVSGSLAELRNLLDDIARYRPETEVPVNAIDAAALHGSDPFLFDGAGLPRIAGGDFGGFETSLSGDAVFLFEESAHPAPISVFDSPLTDKRLAA